MANPTGSKAKYAESPGPGRAGESRHSAGRLLEPGGNARPREMVASNPPKGGLETEFGLHAAATKSTPAGNPKNSRRRLFLTIARI